MCFVVILWCEDITWVCCQRSMNISQRRGYFWSVQDKLFFCPTSREAANGGGGSLQRFSFLSRLGWRVQIVLTWLKRRQFVKMRSLAAKDDYYSSSEGRIEITGKKWNIFAHLILLKEMWELINIQQQHVSCSISDSDDQSAPAPVLCDWPLSRLGMPVLTRRWRVGFKSITRWR